MKHPARCTDLYYSPPADYRPRLLSDNPPCNVDLIPNEIESLSTRVRTHAQPPPEMSPAVSKRGVETWTVVRNRPLLRNEDKI